MKNTLSPNPLPVDPVQVLWCPSARFKNTAWHRALAAGDKDAARSAFVAELRQGPARTSRSTDIPAMVERWEEGEKIGFLHGMRMEPDEVIRQHYVGVSGIEHTFDGEIDWLLDPTENLGERRDANWRATFNRHYHWVPLAERYEETGDAKYAHAFERELRSWIGQTSRPNDDGREPPSCWRPIELGIRCGWTWPLAFEIFRRSEHVSDEALWLMVCSLSEQALQLLLWPTKLNIKSMEINGLIHVGAMFPELARARAFVDTGIDRACSELECQVYDDGCQKELAPSYGILALNNLFSGLWLARERLDGEPGLPPRARDRLALLTRTFAEISTPDAITPPIHDSPPHRVDRLYREFSEFLGGGDWPEHPWRTPRFRHFPWGGWTVFATSTTYALFDSGPWGGKHQHSDALQFLIHAGDRWLCIDPGKPIYNASKVTAHLRSSAAHNVVLMDGRCHLPDPFDSILRQAYPTWVAEEPGVRAVAARRHARIIAEPGAKREPDAPGFWHERCVLELEGIGWLVFDRLEADDGEEHTWEWLWHTAADSLEIRGDAASLEFSGTAALRIQVAGNARLDLFEVGGQREPALRGWRSPGDFEEPVSAATLQATSGLEKQAVVALTLFALPCPTHSFAEISGFQHAGGHASVRLRTGGEERKIQFWWETELTAIKVEETHFPVAPHSVKLDKL